MRDERKLESLTLAELRDERDRCEAELRDAKTSLSAVNEAIHAHVAAEIEERRTYLNKTEGTVDIRMEGFVVKSTVPKRIEWSTDALHRAAQEIRKQGVDASEWIDYKLSVSEKHFKDMPDWMKEIVMPARTLKHGNEKIEIKEDE